MEPLIGLSTNQESDCTEQQDTERDGQCGCTVAIVIVASAHLLTPTETGTLVAFTLVRGFIPTTSTDHSVVWWQIVHRELDDLDDLPAEGVLVAILMIVAVDGHRVRWVVVRAGRVLRAVALEATDSITLVDEYRNHQ